MPGWRLDTTRKTEKISAERKTEQNKIPIKTATPTTGLLKNNTPVERIHPKVKKTTAQIKRVMRIDIKGRYSSTARMHLETTDHEQRAKKINF
jgi:hypothetical protein